MPQGPAAAAIALAALAVVIGLSAVPSLNAGLVALVAAALLAATVAPMAPAALWGTFPVPLFVTLVGVTALFGAASRNGTLDVVLARVLRLLRGHPALLPLTLFLLPMVLAGAGPGNIAAIALLAPVAVPAGCRAGLAPLLVIFLLVTGANAGAFSALAPTGIVANALAERAGLPPAPWSRTFVPVLVAQLLIAVGAWLVLRGRGTCMDVPDGAGGAAAAGGITRAQRLTLLALGVFVIGVAGVGLGPGPLALGLLALLALAGATTQEGALGGVPWGTVVMVTGLPVLIGVVEHAGGLSLLARGIRTVGDEGALAAVAALVSGVISVFSSSSAVVMPTFTALAPELTATAPDRLPGVVAAINVGSHVVDVSPLSTLGALAAASVPDPAARAVTTRRLLWLGLAMAPVGAAACWLVFGVLRIAG